MLKWEIHMWFWGSCISFAAASIFFFLDLFLRPSQDPGRDISIYLLFLQGFSMLYHYYLVTTFRGEALPRPLPPSIVKLLNPQGTVVGWCILLLQHYKVPGGPYLYGAFISGAICIFCSVMLLRPVATDMGVMYSFCALSIGISVRDHKLGPQTWITFTFCIFLANLRAFLEHRAVVAETAAAAAAAMAAEAADDDDVAVDIDTDGGSGEEA